MEDHLKSTTGPKFRQIQKVPLRFHFALSLSLPLAWFISFQRIVGDAHTDRRHISIGRPWSCTCWAICFLVFITWSNDAQLMGPICIWAAKKSRRRGLHSPYTSWLGNWAKHGKEKIWQQQQQVLLLCMQLRWDPWLICHPAFHSLSLSPSPDWLVPSLIN
jgi:hypothetical protein